MFTVLNATGKPLARNDILKATLLGSLPRRRRLIAWRSGTRPRTRLGEDFESLFSHIRAMYGRPGSQVIAGVIEIAEASGGAQAFIEHVLQPAARIFDDMRNARHERVAAIGRDRPVPALSRLALVCRLEAAGDAVVARRTGRMPQGLAALPRAGSIAWPSASASWRSAARSARAGSAPWHRPRSGTARDLDAPTARSSSRARSCAPFSTTCAICMRATPRPPSTCCCA